SSVKVFRIWNGFVGGQHRQELHTEIGADRVAGFGWSRCSSASNDTNYRPRWYAIGHFQNADRVCLDTAGEFPGGPNECALFRSLKQSGRSRCSTRSWSEPGLTVIC